MKPRSYQSRALDDIWNWFSSNAEGNPIVDACVGAGKSLMIALLAQRAVVEFPGTRILVLVHQKELLYQNLQKLRAVWPQADVGLYSAAAGKKTLGRTLTYATIGSIYKDAHKLGHIDLVLADECHLIPNAEKGMWRRLIGDIKRYCPKVRVVGWTGTPFRGNGVWLTAGEQAMFTSIATRVTMTELLELGYLAPLVVAETKSKVDASGVKIEAGDYVISELAKAADKQELVEATCAELCELAAERRKWLVFAVTVEHAHHVRDSLVRRGISAEVVTGETPAAERDEKIADYRAGRIRALVNVAVLTTGFDVPDTDCIALLRATKSPVLYVQIAGRGMRVIGADINESIARGKANCLWLDFTDTTVEQGPVDRVKGKSPAPKGKAEAPFKICDSCGERNPTSVLKCRGCGAPFPEPERIKHGTEASAAAILASMAPTPQEVPVDRVTYAPHYKEGGVAPTLRVEYWSGMAIVAREWVALGHTGYARMKAEQWWNQRKRINQIPGDALAAIEWLEYDKNIIEVPSHVILMKEGKHNQLLGFKWNEKDAAGGADQAPQERAATA